MRLHHVQQRRIKAVILFKIRNRVCAVADDLVCIFRQHQVQSDGFRYCRNVFHNRKAIFHNAPICFDDDILPYKCNKNVANPFPYRNCFVLISKKRDAEASLMMKYYSSVFTTSLRGGFARTFLRFAKRGRPFCIGIFGSPCINGSK